MSMQHTHIDSNSCLAILPIIISRLADMIMAICFIAYLGNIVNLFVLFVE